MAKLAALPGVEIFAGDLMVHADVTKALAGVSRAMLVSGAFSHDQFEVEAHFIEAAARANLEVTVRVSTGTALIKPGTKGAYGRTHHGLAAFIDASKYRVVDLNPDWCVCCLACRRRGARGSPRPRSRRRATHARAAAAPRPGS